MDQQELTHSQREYVRAFDARTVELPTVDFDYYENERRVQPISEVPMPAGNVSHYINRGK